MKDLLNSTLNSYLTKKLNIRRKKEKQRSVKNA